MKPHLPLSLRKALLAAIVAVSVSTYNQTYAADAMGDLTDMTGTTQNVSSITSADTTARLTNTTITSEGDVKIGTPEEEEAAETDTLTMNQSSITSAASMTVDQNMAMNASGLSSKGDLTVTGVITGDNITLKSGDAATGTTGNMHIGGKDDSAKYSDELIKIAGKTDIHATGNITVNHQLELDKESVYGETGQVTLTAGNTINLHGSATKLTGVYATAANGIDIDSLDGVNISKDTTLKTTGVNADITINSAMGRVNRNELSGIEYSAEKGKIKVSGSVNYLTGENLEKSPLKLSAYSGITLHAYSYKGDLLAGNKLDQVIAKTETGDISVTLEGQNAPNIIQYSTLTTNDGNIIMNGGSEGYIYQSELTAKGNNDETGNIDLASDELYFSCLTAPSALAATGDIRAEGHIIVSEKNTSFTTSGTRKSIDLIAKVPEGASITPKLSLTDTSATNSAGSVTLTSEGGSAELTSSTITAEDATVSGTTVNISGGYISASNKATLHTDEKATLSDTRVNAKEVVLTGNDFEVRDGTTIGKTEEGALPRTITAERVTTGTGSINSLTLEATGTSQNSIEAEDISIAAKTAVTLNDGSRVQATDGKVVIDGGTSSTNIINAALVQATDTDPADGEKKDGSVHLIGKVNQINKGATVSAQKDVTLTGNGTEANTGNIVQEATVSSTEGNIALNNRNYLSGSKLSAGKDISITTGESEQQSSHILDSELQAAGVVQITGRTTGRNEENLAVIQGGDTLVESSGRDENGTGIQLNNVAIQQTGEQQSNILATNGGNILLQNRVDMQDAALTLENAATSGARIELNEGDVLNMQQKSRLQGRLSGDGVISKSGGDTLLLDYDHTDFNGSVLVNGSKAVSAAGCVADSSNAGSTVEINADNVAEGQRAGVGAAATIYLKNTDLIVNADHAQIGTLDTTQDTAGDGNNPATGGTLAADGTYTQDNNKRADFRTIGSVLEVQQGTVGDVVQATNMRLSDATLLKLDAAVDADGRVRSDIIEASGRIHAAATTGLNSTTPAAAPSTARVYIALADTDAAANAAEGARTTILKGKMVSDLNADVLYEMEQKNGTSQRKLQDRNMHLENTGNGVDLVFSKNYRSCEKTPQMQQVADALLRASEAVDHTEGTLASGGSELHRILDAFDYTRSEEAARQGLLSLIGNGNLLPQLMLFDSSRHHINNLRRHIRMPECNLSHKGSKISRNSMWLAYTGGFDRLDGDENMGDYKRSAHGAILGYDRQLNCHLRTGIALGYETSTGSADSNDVDGETFFVDAYAAMKSRRFSHKASIGLAFSSFEGSRNIHIDAGYHSYSGSATSEMDALTLNLGYEISADYQLRHGATLTPYAAINLAWHNPDDLKENGLGGIGVSTEYDSEWQLDVAAGVTYSREFAARRNAGPARFFANAAVHAELLNDQVSANSRLGKDGPSWEMESMERNPLYLELGTGVAVPLNHSWTATASGALEIGTERSSFNINAGVHYSF